MITIIIVRYGELTTKSKNRNDFIKKLKLNIHKILDNFTFKIIYFHDRMEIIDFKLEEADEIVKILSKVFGISSLSVAFRITRDLEILKEKVLELITKSENKKAKTFKLFISRSDKTFPLNSDAIIKLLATKILEETPLKVNVHNPDLSINIKVNKKDIYLYIDKILGAGGLPVGSSGKVLLLLSGGIDSPVAAYKLMKRGLEVQYLHFATPPYTNENALNKVKNLVKILKSANAGNEKLYICNFTNIQNELTHIRKESYRITLMRRMFIRIACQLAFKLKIQSLATGEAIGQVASQTLASINVINSVSTLPILRSLISEDKIDIINFAQKIGTYQTSILPFADCCSLFVPKNPITQPRISEAVILEEELKNLVDWEQLILDAVTDINK